MLSAEEIIDLVFKTPDKPTRAFIIYGPPGVGKTRLTHEIAKQWKANEVFIQCTLGMDENQLIYQYIPSSTSKSGIAVVHGKLVEALVSSKKRRTVLVLDEWDKTNPRADAMLYDFLQNCRVSWITSEERDIIEGKPENLMVFLTSNKEREFSDPLNRRCITYAMRQFTEIEMLNILKKTYHVCDEHLAVLVQLFKDTISAGLSKPATIQELVQLEHILHKEPKTNFDELVYSYVIKTEDAWEEYTKYLQSVKRETRLQWQTTEPVKESQITTFYQGEVKEKKPEEEVKKPEAPKPPAKPDLKLQIKIEKPEEKLKLPEIKLEPEQMTYGYAFDDKEQTLYTFLVKRGATITDDPTKLGDFTVRKINDHNLIICNRPATLKDILLEDGFFYILPGEKDYSEWWKLSHQSELYLKDKLWVSDKIIEDVKNIATRIKYITKTHVAFEIGDYSTFVLTPQTDGSYLLEGKFKMPPEDANDNVRSGYRDKQREIFSGFRCLALYHIRQDIISLFKKIYYIKYPSETAKGGWGWYKDENLSLEFTNYDEYLKLFRALPELLEKFIEYPELVENIVYGRYNEIRLLNISSLQSPTPKFILFFSDYIYDPNKKYYLENVSNSFIYENKMKEAIKPLTNKLIEMTRAIKHTPPTPEEVREILRFVINEILDENKYMAFHRKVEKEYMKEDPKAKWVEQR